jgi:hypothetical protein
LVQGAGNGFNFGSGHIDGTGFAHTTCTALRAPKAKT